MLGSVDRGHARRLVDALARHDGRGHVGRRRHGAGPCQGLQPRGVGAGFPQLLLQAVTVGFGRGGVQLQQHVALEQVLPVATVDPLHAEVQEQAVVQEDQDAEVRAVKVVHASSAQSLNTIRRLSIFDE